MSSQHQLEFRLHQHARKGGKTHRYRQIQRVRRFLRWADMPAHNVGKRQVHEFYRSECRSKTMRRDYYYAFRLLWRALGRDSNPPRPDE